MGMTWRMWCVWVMVKGCGFEGFVVGRVNKENKGIGRDGGMRWKEERGLIKDRM